MKFTKEEISLCKQIAEKHRKRIVFGIWFHDLEDPEHLPFLWCNLTDELKRRSAVPLWTISDCLEFLRGKGYRVDILETEGRYETFIVKCHGHKTKLVIYQHSNTPLEACLKAVLAVLE